MYAFIKGTLVQASVTEAVVENNGIGYLVSIPASALGTLPSIGSEVTFHISFIVRENSQALFGFLSLQEKSVFEALISISGIGPKLALSIIGHLPIEDLHTAIHHHDVKAISRVPGIGKKTAERLIIEMRDKLAESFSVSPSELAISLPKDAEEQKIHDAMSALIQLGYNQVSAKQAVDKSLKALPKECDLTALITEALQNT